MARCYIIFTSKAHARTGEYNNTFFLRCWISTESLDHILTSTETVDTMSSESRLEIFLPDCHDFMIDVKMRNTFVWNKAIHLLTIITNISLVVFFSPLGNEDPNCKDTRKYCRAWSRHGHCRTNPSFMLNHCKLACKVCVPIS